MCLPVAAIRDFRLRPPPMGTGGALCLSVGTLSQVALFNSSKSSAPEPYEPLPIFYSRQHRYRLLARPPAYSGHI